jgi:uncharacterized protein YkwD
MGTRAVKGLAALAYLAVLTVVAAPVASSSPSSTTAGTRASLAALETGVLQQMNTIRAQYGLEPLRANPGLAAAAAQHSREMGADGYFDHASPNGGAFWLRVAHWYPSAGFTRWSVGENLLWYSPDLNPAVAVDMWMHSPEHRANILNPRWRDLGVGAVHLTSGSGTYRARPVTILTADFGVRR